MNQSLNKISFHFNHALHKGCPSSGFFLTHFWFSPNMGKYGSEKTPHSDTFHAVTLLMNRVLPFLWGKVKVKGCLLQYWMKYLGKSKKKQGKWNRTRKLWYLLWCSFWPILWKVSFWKRNCALHYGSIFIFRLSWHTWFVKILKSFSNSWGKNYFTCIYSNTY